MCSALGPIWVGELTCPCFSVFITYLASRLQALSPSAVFKYSSAPGSEIPPASLQSSSPIRPYECGLSTRVPCCPAIPWCLSRGSVLVLLYLAGWARERGQLRAEGGCWASSPSSKGAAGSSFECEWVITGSGGWRSGGPVPQGFPSPSAVSCPLSSTTSIPQSWP